MEASPKWFPLPGFPDLPALLVSARFTPTSYELFVTDLANLWTEKLDRKAILLRSLQENTCIDLSDGDPEQWAVFMSKLQAAIDPTTSDHGLTSISISASDDRKNQDGLNMHITCELPKPLDALHWPVRLTRCQPASLASELVLPLIQAHHEQRCEAEDLKNQLKAKDVVISKLLDKLDVMRVPLEQIFNSLSAKHAVTREAAEDKIKGLAPFDEVKWTSQRTVKSTPDASAFFQCVFGRSGFSCESDMDYGVSSTLNGWWKSLSPGLHTASTSAKKKPRQEAKEKAVVSTTPSEETDSEDFQVQTTPERLPSRPARHSSPAKPELHSDTEDSDASGKRQAKPRSRIGVLRGKSRSTENHSTSQSSNTIRADDDTASGSDTEEAEPPRLKTLSTRLGTIGKSKKTASSSKTTGRSSPDPHTGLNDATASGSDSDNEKPEGPSSSLMAKPITPRKGALGRIGGKPKASPSPAKGSSKSPSNTKLDDDEVPTSPKKPDTRKIGAIGRSARTEPKRAHSNTPTEPEQSETDEQKAERKRAELAKELSSKNTAPVRKKRKF
ncbi:XLF-domain-containing protein [Poronia punctata]|nr:XLF-domain-containing protein [Poronia punctata]